MANNDKTFFDKLKNMRKEHKKKEENTNPKETKSSKDDKKDILSASFILDKYGYDLKNTIGSGSFADVRLAVSSKDKRNVAIKIISRQKNKKDFIIRFVPREINILRKLEHPNIIKFIKAIQTPTIIFIIMELAENGTLLQAINKNKYIDECLSCRWFHHLVDGMTFLHSNGIVHRDIKCENLLLDKNNVIKITDFGFSRGHLPSYIVNGEENTSRIKELSTTYCGSFAYASPEILLNKPYEPHLSDVWSMGVVLYIMVCGYLPFKDESLSVLIKKQQEPLEFPSMPKISNICKDLILSILSPLEKRIYLPGIKKHKWYIVMWKMYFNTRKKSQINILDSSERVIFPRKKIVDKYQRMATLRDVFSKEKATRKSSKIHQTKDRNEKYDFIFENGINKKEITAIRETDKRNSSYESSPETIEKMTNSNIPIQKNSYKFLNKQSNEEKKTIENDNYQDENIKNILEASQISIHLKNLHSKIDLISSEKSQSKRFSDNENDSLEKVKSSERSISKESKSSKQTVISSDSDTNNANFFLTKSLWESLSSSQNKEYSETSKKDQLERIDMVPNYGNDTNQMEDMHIENQQIKEEMKFKNFIEALTESIKNKESSIQITYSSTKQISSHKFYKKDDKAKSSDTTDHSLKLISEDYSVIPKEELIYLSEKDISDDIIEEKKYEMDNGTIFQHPDAIITAIDLPVTKLLEEEFVNKDNLIQQDKSSTESTNKFIEEEFIDTDTSVLQENFSVENVNIIEVPDDINIPNSKNSFVQTTKFVEEEYVDKNFPIIQENCSTRNIMNEEVFNSVNIANIDKTETNILTEKINDIIMKED